MTLLERALSKLPPDARGRPAAGETIATAALLLRAQGLPEARDEHWQHANLKALSRVSHFLTELPVQLSELVLPALPERLPGFERIVTINGRLLQPARMVGADTASHHLAAPRGDTGSDPDLRFALLARVFGDTALMLQLGGEHSIEWVNICDARFGSAYPRLQLQLAAGARVHLVERLVGAVDAAAIICTDLNVRLADGAALTHTRLHAPAGGSVLLDNLSVSLAARAVYRVDHIAAGQAQARSTCIVDLVGNACELHWNGVAAVSAGDGFDALVRVTHRGKAARTAHRFRGICVGTARLGCDADVRVLASAAGSKVAQSLRALNDGAGTHVSLRPRLTIETDDIQASHGATTGQLDGTLLFYLLSRGIDPATARSLLKWAFLEDVLAGIAPPALRQQAEQLTATQLAEVAALELQS
jgi:Fe-S cluster assembly protein SufD